MTEKEFTCVVCPNGCWIKVCYEESAPPRLIGVEGARCLRGESWAKQEIESPMRTFSSSVIVSGGDFLEASVRLTKPVPLVKVFEVLAEIKKIRLSAPLKIGDIVLRNPAGTETEVIVTRNVHLNMKEKIVSQTKRR